MNRASKSAAPIAAALAIVGMALAYSAPVLAYDVDDEMLAMENEFSLGNGDSKLIADHRTPEPYRVCVAKGRNAVPLLARYDGQERKISVGDCSDLTAKTISIAPAGKLEDDVVLVGKYKHLKN
jgi:hypothetical protein